MAVYFDFKIPTHPGCHDLIEWHKTYCLLAISIHCSTTSDASVEFYKDEVSIVFAAMQFEHSTTEDVVMLLLLLHHV